MSYKHGLHEVKYQYCLHDTVINRFICTNEGIVIEFDNGVYLLDETGKAMELSEKCRLQLIINYFDRQKTYEHIDIKIIRKNKIKEVEFAEFQTMLAKDIFKVHLDFYSPFADCLLIKGIVGKYEVEFSVTEIARLSFVFEN